MMDALFILYVADQERSTRFYSELLLLGPSLHVPGMTEFKLSETAKLGLMPESGIAKILSPPMPDPKGGNGMPRCELYLRVHNAGGYIERGVLLGARLVSALQLRNWGEEVAYLSDADGHIIAFAESTSSLIKAG